MIDPILLAAGKLASAADGVVRCLSVMEFSDRIRTLEARLTEYNLLILAAPELTARPSDEVLDEYLSSQGPTPNQIYKLEKLLDAGGPFDYLYPLQRALHRCEYYIQNTMGDLYLHQGSNVIQQLLRERQSDNVPDGRFYIPYHKL